jgi:hypothetical protein
MITERVAYAHSGPEARSCPETGHVLVLRRDDDPSDLAALTNLTAGGRENVNEAMNFSARTLRRLHT